MLASRSISLPPIRASRLQPGRPRRAQHAVTKAEFDVDNASVLVAGGCTAVAVRSFSRLAPRRRYLSVALPPSGNSNGPGGGGCALQITKRLKDAGSWVWQLQRTDVRRKEIESMMAIVVNGDACQVEDVEKAFAAIDGVDAVVSTIGGTTADPTADSQGNINLIDAAVRHGVKKFVLVTSIGTGNSKGAPPPHVYDVLKPVLLEKEKAEERLKEVGDKMTFVIVRPGGLKSEPATGTGVLTEDVTVCGSITREDVADLVLKALRSDLANNKVLSAVDRATMDDQFEVFSL